MRECLGKHSCMSSPLPIAMLNGTSLFLSLVHDKLNMPNGHYYRLCVERTKTIINIGIGPEVAVQTI